MKVLAYVIVILFFLGLVGKVADHEEAIKEMKSPETVTVAKVDLTEKTVMQIAIMEKEIDMLKLRVEELESNIATNKVE